MDVVLVNRQILSYSLGALLAVDLKIGSYHTRMPIDVVAETAKIRKVPGKGL
jgi:hypothetical protein